jgi:leucyl-tRNA synthetase
MKASLSRAILGKMGKSLKNSISPDEVIAHLWLRHVPISTKCILGPLEQSKTWDTEAIVGVHRFLQRAWRNLISAKTEMIFWSILKDSEGKLKSTYCIRPLPTSPRLMGDMRYNAAIAKLIELNNALVWNGKNSSKTSQKISC